MKIFPRRGPLNPEAHPRADRVLLILALVVFLAFLFLRGGLGGKFERRPGALVFTQWWRDELEKDTLESLVREFEERNPSIQIELRHLSYREIRDSLTGSTPGIPPEQGLLARTDLIGLDPLWLGDLIRAGALASLEEEPEDRETPPDEALIREGAVPLISFIIPLFYNIDALAAAGFNRPPKTWKEFLEVSRALARNGRFGLGLALSPDNPGGVYRELFPWFWAAGTALIPGGTPSLNGRAVTGVFEFLEELQRENLISPGSFSKTPGEKQKEFIAGRIGMMTGSIQDRALLGEGMGTGRFGVTALPGPDSFAGTAAFGLSSWYAGISARSGHPEEGRAFLAFLEERAARLAAGARAVPGVLRGAPFPSLPPDPAAEEDPLSAKAWDLYEGGTVIREFDGVPRFRDMEALFRLEFIGLFEGNQTPAGAAASIQSGWERLLLP